MSKPLTKNHRILALAPSTRGCGFAVLEGEQSLVDWGIKSVKGDKNKQSLVKVKELITHYQPHVIVIEDCEAASSKRSERIRNLSKMIISLAASFDVKVVLFSRERILRSFFADSKATKHALAELLAQKFPEELGTRLPPKRRPWESQDYRMDIFDAVALAVASRSS